LGKKGKVLWFADTEPNTEYQVTVYQGLPGLNGQLLAQNVSSQLTTRHLEPSVNFTSDGLFLTDGLGNGLPVNTVNVDEVNVDFFRIREDKIPEFLREVDYYGRVTWSTEHLTQMAELAYSGRYDLEPEKNKVTARTIKVEGVTELEQPGLYLAVMMPAGHYERKMMSWYAVTDIGLHARFYGNRLAVHASSLAKATAIGEAEVSLIDKQGKVLASSKTTPEGLASFEQEIDKAALIVARKGMHYSLLEVHQPALDLSRFDIGTRPQLPMELFVYGPRDLYRPGEQVDFAALLRDGDGELKDTPVLDAVIRRPDGTEARSFKWQPDQNGFLSYSWQAPSDAPLGRWELSISGALKQPVVYPFNVEQFLPERMKLTLNPDSSERLVLGADDRLKLPLQGDYLYGAPASGNRVSAELYIRHWRSPIEALADFEFGDERDSGVIGQHSLDDIKLSKEGSGTLSQPSVWQQTRSPLRLKVQASLYETGGRAINRSHDLLVWPKPAMLGIRSSFADQNPDAESVVKFELVKASLTGEKQAAEQLDVRLVREDRNYFWVYSEDRGWHYQWSDKEYVVASTTADIASGAVAEVSFPVEWGRYRLEVEDKQNGLLSSKRFFAGEDWYSNWRHAEHGTDRVRPDQVNLALDKAAYKAGDTARVRISPPEAGEALVMVEGDGPLWMSRVSIPAEGAEVEIPIADNWKQHNLYVTTLLLRGGKQQQGVIAPKRSLGVIHLPLDREARRLDVAIEAPEKVVPGKVVNTRVKVADTGGKAFVTLAAVDVGVLSLTEYKTPDPYEAFFGQRRYSVDSRDLYHKVIDISDAQHARLRFGGDADLQRGGAQPQSEVQIVSMFSGLVAVDEQGYADVELDIPQFNGQLRLMALSFDQRRFGSAEKSLTIASPVVTQFAMPRFLAFGDQSQVALDLTNMSGESQQLSVELNVDGPVALKDAAQKVMMLEVEDGERRTLVYPVEATGFTGAAQFSLSLSSKKLEEPIERSWTLGVRPGYPPEQTVRYQLLKPGLGYEQPLPILNRILSETAVGSLSLSSTVDLGLRSQLKNLLQYPYGCLEQTSSRVYPLVSASPDRLAALKLPGISAEERLKRVDSGIERISAMQLESGGFGLWDNQSMEEHWLTAYVADLLLDSRDNGFAVPDKMLNSALQRLKEYLQNRNGFYDERYSGDSQHYRLAYRAYAGYVLSRVNQAPLGTLRQLYQRDAKQAEAPLPLLHLSLAFLQSGDLTRMQAALDKMKRQQRSRKYLADYGSKLRDKALTVALMLRHELEPEYALEQARELRSLLIERRYLSTQERNALFMAGIQLQQHTGESWQAKLVTATGEEILAADSNLTKSLDANQLQPGLTVYNKSEQPLYLTLRVQGFGNQAPEPVSDGLRIERAYYNLQGDQVDPKTVASGETLIVHLRVEAKRKVPDALVVDLIPAGFELENQNLANPQSTDELSIGGEYRLSAVMEDTDLRYQEYRDDRYVAALSVEQNRASHLFYLMRAVTPGSYRVPPPLAEDMYRPEIRALGRTPELIRVEASN